METDQHLWRVWITAINRWGLQDWLASMLDAAGALTVVGAQVIYLAQPLLNFVLPDKDLIAAAKLLEEPESTQAFIQLLREAARQ
jgi:hypothetical protein